MPNPTITISPSPATQGKDITITYSGPPGAVLALDWDPAAEPSSATVGKNGEVVVTCPTNATSLIVSDVRGNTASAIVSP